MDEVQWALDEAAEDTNSPAYVLAAEVRRLREMERRARDIYAHPAEHGVEAWRAARNILGLNPPATDGEQE